MGRDLHTEITPRTLADFSSAQAHSLFARKCDQDGREAALIALYGIRNSRIFAAPPIRCDAITSRHRHPDETRRMPARSIPSKLKSGE
jgi:hypothetical protein